MISRLIVSSVLALGSCALFAQAPIISHDFKDSVAGWAGAGMSAKVSVSHEAGIVQPAAGALKFDYKIEKPGFNFLSLSTGLGSLAKAKSIKFRVRADATTTLAVVLQEQDGGRYISEFTAPKDTWQSIELSPSDFILSRDAGDPVDPDGKLDMDRITTIGLFDLSQFFAQLDTSSNPLLGSLFNVTKGDHSFYIDSFEVGTDAVPGSTSSAGSDVTVESFVHPQVSWVGLGGVTLKRVSEKPLNGTVLKATYHQAPAKISILLRPIPSWIFVGSKILAFDVAAEKPSTLIVQFEQTDGGKYNMTVEVPGGSEVKHLKLALVGFQRGDDSTDTGTRINLGIIKSMNIIDASGMIKQADADNTLWIGPIHATGE